MKLEDRIAKSIYEYPSLYKDKDYKSSRIKVLEHLFLTIGNGYEWASTKDPMKGGYLTEESPKGKYHLPYGYEKFKIVLDEDYFASSIYYIGGLFISNHEAHIAKIIKKKHLYRRGLDVLIQIKGIQKEEDIDTTSTKDDITKKSLIRLCREPQLIEAKSDYPFKPYPISKYSALREIYDKNLFVQPDWMQGAIDVTKEILKYFNTDNNPVWKEDHYYPSNNSIKREKRSFEEALEKSPKDLNNLRKLWGYGPGTKIPILKEIKEKNEKTWQSYKNNYVYFLEKFLNKYVHKKSTSLNQSSLI